MDDLTYIAARTERHSLALDAMHRLGIIEALRPFNPVLCGTIPLGIDLPVSDLDIICEARDLAAFEAVVVERFGHLAGFSSRRREKQGLPAFIANFDAEGFAFEIFGQPLPVSRQNAYRHMVAEGRLLNAAGPEAAEAIRALKAKGLKTEPAFARYFGLEGDPYEALLELYAATDEELITVARRRPPCDPGTPCPPPGAGNG